MKYKKYEIKNKNTYKTWKTYWISVDIIVINIIWKKAFL